VPPVRIAEGAAQKVTIDEKDLGKFSDDEIRERGALRTAMPGVARGSHGPPVGGHILFIEASRTPGSGKLILTGQLAT